MLHLHLTAAAAALQHAGSWANQISQA